MANKNSETAKRIETTKILNTSKYYLKNIIKDYIRSQEDFEVVNLYNSDLKNDFINDAIESAASESLYLYNNDEKFQLYIKIDTLYNNILKNTIIEYKNEMTAEYEREKQEFLQSPEGQKWQHKQEVKKAWQEVKESWRPAKKQLASGAINAGIITGSFFRALAKNSKPRKNSIFK